MQALRTEREKFEKERETMIKSMKEKREILHQRELEAQK
jgi:hypothetical protein